MQALAEAMIELWTLSKKRCSKLIEDGKPQSETGTGCGKMKLTIHSKSYNDNLMITLKQNAANPNF